MATPDAFWQGLPLGRGVALLQAAANGLGALDKPAGLLSHPNPDGGCSRSLLNATYSLKKECYTWEVGAANHRLWLLNRLDSATSGVILVCADERLAGLMRRQFQQKKVRKIYRVLVFGRPAVPRQEWHDHLAIAKHGGHIRTTAGGNIPVQCRMTLLASQGGKSLLQLEPTTGRSHQLRVQCAKHGLPIVGDATYGDFTKNRAFAKACGNKRLFLHSLTTSFHYEWEGKAQAFAATSPQPPEFSLPG